MPTRNNEIVGRNMMIAWVRERQFQSSPFTGSRDLHRYRWKPSRYPTSTRAATDITATIAAITWNATIEDGIISTAYTPNREIKHFSVIVHTPLCLSPLSFLLIRIQLFSEVKNTTRDPHFSRSFILCRKRSLGRAFMLSVLILGLFLKMSWEMNSSDEAPSLLTKPAFFRIVVSFQ